MLVTLFGIVTPARLVQVSKAWLPMLVTSRPLVVLGMITSLPRPVYAIIVIVPLLVVKLNWASTLVGNVRRSSNARIIHKAEKEQGGFVFMAVLVLKYLRQFVGAKSIQKSRVKPFRLSESFQNPLA